MPSLSNCSGVWGSSGCSPDQYPITKMQPLRFKMASLRPNGKAKSHYEVGNRHSKQQKKSQTFSLKRRKNQSMQRLMCDVQRAVALCSASSHSLWCCFCSGLFVLLNVTVHNLTVSRPGQSVWLPSIYYTVTRMLSSKFISAFCHTLLSYIYTLVYICFVSVLFVFAVCLVEQVNMSPFLSFGQSTTRCSIPKFHQNQTSGPVMCDVCKDSCQGLLSAIRIDIINYYKLK